MNSPIMLEKSDRHPVLFHILVNNLDELTLRQFASAAKLGGVAGVAQDCAAIPQNLHSPYSWTEELN